MKTYITEAHTNKRERSAIPYVNLKLILKRDSVLITAAYVSILTHQYIPV